MLIELDGVNYSLYAINDNKLFEMLYGEEGLLDPIECNEPL
jgi:hypothetical protein